MNGHEVAAARVGGGGGIDDTVDADRRAFAVLLRVCHFEFGGQCHPGHVGRCGGRGARSLLVVQVAVARL